MYIVFAKIVDVYVPYTHTYIIIYTHIYIICYIQSKNREKLLIFCLRQAVIVITDFRYSVKTGPVLTILLLKFIILRWFVFCFCFLGNVIIHHISYKWCKYLCTYKHTHSLTRVPTHLANTHSYTKPPKQKYCLKHVTHPGFIKILK